MSWYDKAVKKQKTKQQVKDIMNMPEFKKWELVNQQQAVLNAMVNVSFITCQYLEYKHGYKKKGLQTFLKYLYDVMVEIGENNDDEFFQASEKYYKEQLGLDVMQELNLERGK